MATNKGRYYCAFRSLNKSRYACIALSCDCPFKPFQASHLARLMKSVMPGRSPCASPRLPCLYKAYIFSSVMLSGRSGRLFESATACSKSAFKLMFYPSSQNGGLKPPLVVLCKRGLNAEQFHFEDQGGIRRDDA